MTLVWTQSRVYPFTISRPPPLASFPPTRMKYHHYVSASKGCRGIFNIRGRPPRFRFFTLGLTIPIPFFRLRERPRVMRIQILSPRSVETNFADAWTLSVRRNFVCSVKVCEWGRRLINSTEMNDEFFQEKRKGRSFLIFVGVENNNFSIKGWWCPRSAIIQPRIKFRLINTILARILETRDNRFNPLQDSTNTFTHSLIISPSSPSKQWEFELNFQSTHDLSSDISLPGSSSGYDKSLPRVCHRNCGISRVHMERESSLLAKAKIVDT